MISLSLIIIICLLLLILMICISYIYIKYLTKKLYNKHISEKTNQNQNSVINNKPLMIIGPSGVGKDTFMQKIIAKYPNIFLKCVSCTTRPPRENEKDGVNYFFITKEKFEQLDKNNKIIGKFEKYGNLYGSKLFFSFSLIELSLFCSSLILISVFLYLFSFSFIYYFFKN